MKLKQWLQRGQTIRTLQLRTENQRRELARLYEARDRHRSWAVRQAHQARKTAWRIAERNVRLRDTITDLNQRAQVAETARLELARTLSKPPRIRVIQAKHPVAHRPARTVTIGGTGTCIVCGTLETKLTDHHPFGRTIPIVVRTCTTCHEGFHVQLSRGQLHDAVPAMLTAVATAFRNHDEKASA